MQDGLRCAVYAVTHRLGPQIVGCADEGGASVARSMGFVPQPILHLNFFVRCRSGADGLVGYAANSAANPPYIYLATIQNVVLQEQ